jgi:hypothetical protein
MHEALDITVLPSSIFQLEQHSLVRTIHRHWRASDIEWLTAAVCLVRWSQTTRPHGLPTRGALNQPTTTSIGHMGHNFNSYESYWAGVLHSPHLEGCSTGLTTRTHAHEGLCFEHHCKTLLQRLLTTQLLTQMGPHTHSTSLTLSSSLHVTPGFKGKIRCTDFICARIKIHTCNDRVNTKNSAKT